MIALQIERGILPDYPGEGRPCNGCGVCCLSTACKIALAYVDGARIGSSCPAVMFVDGRTRCGMAIAPSRFGRVTPEAEGLFRCHVKLSLGDGTCDTKATVLR